VANGFVGDEAAWLASLVGATGATGATGAAGADGADGADGAGLSGGNWKVFYTNGSGVLQELALGADGTYLKSNGATSAPTFATPAGGSGGLGYTLIASSATHNVSDSVTNFIGSGYLLAPQGTGGLVRLYIPKTGTIKTVYVTARATSTVGTGESWEMFVRLNDTADTSIQAITSTDNPRVWSNTSMSVSVTVGDYIEIKSVTPNFATNPLTVRYYAVIYIE
jgi:hypothetical protein